MGICKFTKSNINSELQFDIIPLSKPQNCSRAQSKKSTTHEVSSVYLDSDQAIFNELGNDSKCVIFEQEKRNKVQREVLIQRHPQSQEKKFLLVYDSAYLLYKKKMLQYKKENLNVLQAEQGPEFDDFFELQHKSYTINLEPSIYQ